MPSEYWSLCGPARRPEHCSGLMKGGVPITVPSAVGVTSDARSATPKSDTMTRPSRSTRKFAPFKSRCTIPRSGAYPGALGGPAPTHHTTGPGAPQLVLDLVFAGEHHPYALQQLGLVLDREHQRGLERVRGPGATTAAEARVRRHVGAALEALALHGLTWSAWVSVGAVAESVSIELSRRIVSVALPVFRPISESRPGVSATMDVSDDVMLR